MNTFCCDVFARSLSVTGAQMGKRENIWARVTTE
jgi:hypothetical protein